MTILTFLADLRDLGVRLWVEGDRLRYSAPPGVLTAALRAEIAARRADILSVLRAAERSGRAQPSPIVPIPRDDPIPASFPQQRLWFLEQLGMGAGYVVAVALHLSGSLNAAALEQSFAEIVRRHETLRTTFVELDGQPMQVIAPALRIPITTIDLRHHSESERAAAARGLIEAIIRQPFDLLRGPLIRMSLLRQDDDEHTLLLTMHHIITDGWSFDVLFHELSVHYSAYATGTETQPGTPVLPDLPIQYADFAHWQHASVNSAAFAAQLDYWKDRLAGSSALLAVPADRPRPPQLTMRGATLRWEMPQPLLEALRALSRQEHATLFMTMLAAFAILLSRYTAQVDIPIGLPVANRTRSEIEALIGFFVNMLVLRADLSGAPTFRELLRRIRAAALGAYAHQDLPFEQLVRALQPVRTLNYQPLFQVMFEFEHAVTRTPTLHGLIVTYEWLATGATQFDLALLIEETAAGVRASWEYATDLFDAATIDRVAQNFEVLLWGIVRDPDRPVAALPLLTDAERRQLLIAWNTTAADYPRDQCLHHLVEEQVERTPDAVAAIHEDRQLTYRELQQHADRLAQRLQAIGVGPEVPVGLCVERSIEMMVGLLGILKAGGAYVPIDPTYPRERIGLMLEDAQVAVLVTQQRLLSQLPAHLARTICLDAVPTPPTAMSAVPPARPVTADHLAYIIYTSGSTGQPKGVQILHRSVVNLLCAMARQFALGPQDTVVAVTTLAFDIAALELFLPLITGARLVIASRAVASDGAGLAELLASTGATVLQATPTTWRMLLAAGWPGSSGLTMLCGGEALPLSLAQQLLPRGRALWNMYGPSETTIWSTCCQVSAGDATVSLGRPLANTQLYVLDAQLQPVPIGVPGELYIGGDGLARGYLNRPELTDEKFISNPFAVSSRRSAVASQQPLTTADWQLPTGDCRLYKTGDLVRWRPDGRLEFLDRIDEQVKIRGFRIEPGEIEAYLNQHPAVRASVVMAREDRSDDRRLVAYVLPAASAAIAEASTEGDRRQMPLAWELRAYLQSRLPAYMVPASFVLLDALPLTPNGKLDRSALPAPAVTGRDHEIAYVAPRTPFEDRVAALWAATLGLERVGMDDNFFDLGGHSLQAVQLTTRMSTALGRTVSVKDIFLHPTVATLVAALQQRPPANTRPAHAGDAVHVESSAAAGLTIEHRAVLPLIVSGSLAPVDSAVLSYLPAAAIEPGASDTAMLSRADLLHDWYDNLPGIDEVLTTHLGRIALITLPRFDDQLYDTPDELIKSMVRGLDLAAQIGARVVSLAGLLPSATNYGRRLAAAVEGRSDLPLITTGHATTAATVVMAIRRILAESGRHFAGERVGYLGLGSIGLATLRLALCCLPHPRELILCDLYSKYDSMVRIEQELVDVFGFRGPIRIIAAPGEIPPEFYSATTIIGATNVPDVLDIGRVNPGTLIVDDSWPHCFNARSVIARFAQRGDVLFTEGGVLQAPKAISTLRYLPRALERSLPAPYRAAVTWHQPHEITGCILSSLLTARFAQISPTLGYVDAATCQQHFVVLDELGFQGARLHCDYYVLPEPIIAAFRQRFGT